MNKVQERKMAMLERIDVFFTKHPITPAIPRITELATQLKAALTAMREQGGGQQEGFGDYMGGTQERKDVAHRVLGDIREISDVVTSLDPVAFPGMAEKFQMPRIRSYQRLMDTARAFIGEIAPVEAAL